MKRVFLLVTVIALCFSCKTEPTLPPDTYEINVTAKGVYNGMRAYLGIKERTRRDPIFIDTAMVVNETMTFRGKVKNPAIRLIRIPGINGDLYFVLEPGVTNIEFYKDSIHASVASGGKNNEMYQLYKDEQRKRSQKINDTREELRMSRQQNDTALYQKLYNDNRALVDELNLFTYDFVSEHPEEQFSLLILESLLSGPKPNLERLKENLSELEGVIRNNPANQLVAQKIRTYIAEKEALANLDIGKVAPEFSSTTPDGEVLALKDIRGKATIVEFWASWCGPCRRENPNIVNVYNKYHDKGLEIIGISLDRPNNKQRWLDAIEKDKLTWHHVSSLKYFNDPVARMYNISSIPASFILDENGVIVAKKLRGRALEEQISQMLD